MIIVIIRKYFVNWGRRFGMFCGNLMDLWQLDHRNWLDPLTCWSAQKKYSSKRSTQEWEDVEHCSYYGLATCLMEVRMMPWLRHWGGHGGDGDNRDVVGWLYYTQCRISIACHASSILLLLLRPTLILRIKIVVSIKALYLAPIKQHEGHNHSDALWKTWRSMINSKKYSVILPNEAILYSLCARCVAALGWILRTK